MKLSNLLLFMFFISSVLLAQYEGEKKPMKGQEKGMAQEQQEMTPEMKAWMEFMQPSWGHELLAGMVGEWKTTTKYWAAPGTDPELSNGNAEAKLILGGRYLEEKHTGTAMGMPFEGYNLIGFDNAKQEFVNVWIDNLGTGMSMASGKYDKKYKTYTMYGSMTDPMTKKEVKFKQILKIPDNDTQVLEMFMDHEGKEFRTMEITFKRR